MASGLVTYHVSYRDAVSFSSFARRNHVQEELLKLEKDFAHAIVNNDAEAIAQFLADEWVIVDPDGGIIDRTPFLGVIKAGTLTHQKMESDDVTVRIYGNSAIVTGLTTSEGKFMGQAFTTHERTTDVFVNQRGQWQCVFTQLTRFTKR